MTIGWLRNLSLLALIGLAAPVNALAQSFDGITIIELADQDGQHILNGKGGGSNPYLVTYVASNGTYAAVEDGNKRSCVAWAQKGSYTGRSITFGTPPTEQSVKLFYPSICLPFTLRYETPDTVSVDADNKYDAQDGPLAKDAQRVHYKRRHHVIAHVPLVAVDWRLPFYSKLAIKDVRLGPLSAMRAALNGTPKITLYPLESTYRGVRKPITIVRTPNDRQNSRTVSGYVAAAEVMGWPWDVLYGAWYKEYLPHRSSVKAFDEAVVQQYGPPSLKETVKSSARRVQYWFVDLSGRQIGLDEAGPNNCLATKKLWEQEGSLSGINVDIGPWGCAAVVRLADDGNSRGMVSEYNIEAVSGYTAALNHFLRRLDELRVMRQKIQSVRSNPVKL